ncbi:MAG TPA: response regulator transcription factor [Longimicrobium sp.]|nr:response regulator transcription factor [Longimicrobium sp.]
MDHLEIRILLADDHVVMRTGVAALLNAEPDMRVVAQVPTGEDAVEQARLLRPDVVVMDLDMPGIGGLEATRRIGELGVDASVLVLTMHDESEFLLPVLEAGGSGYVRKTTTEDDLAAAIRVVARREVFLYPAAARLLLQGYRRAQERGTIDPVEELSDREREVLALAAEGFSSKSIGRQLGISSKTVDTYRSRLMRKLGLTSRTDLVHFALTNGLLSFPAMARGA